MAAGSYYDVFDVMRALRRIPNAVGRVLAARRHRKMLRKAPLFQLTALPENTFGKVIGLARPEGKRVLESPLSGRLCVYYEVTFDLMTSPDAFIELGTEQEGIAFVVDDGTAQALVDPANASMSTGVDRVTTSVVEVAPPREEALLRRLAAMGKQVNGQHKIRYRESIIEVDERIAVHGAAVREPDPTGDQADRMYRDGPPTRLLFTGTERFPLFISDDPRALRR